MGYATRLGRARISAVAPQAAGQCDRCGFMFTLSKLQWQMDYAGAGLVNKRLLVCHSCMDRPQDQFRAIVIPADPVPVQNPRPPEFARQRTDKRITIGKQIKHPFTGLVSNTGDQRITEDKQDRIVQANGDGMFSPKYVSFYRITQTNEYRKTQDNDNRITGLLPPSPNPPGPGPGPVGNGVRLTQAGGIRISQDGRLREITKSVFIVAGRLTIEGGERVTQSNMLRGSLIETDAMKASKREENG